MAATFVVEDGTGLSNANSYLSVAEADTYHENHSGSSAWCSANQANKEKALRLATQYLDVQYCNRWKGYRANEGQALTWPRTYAYDDDGYSYDSNEIPQRLKNACAELALRVIQGDTLLDDISKPGTIKSKSVKVGPIEKTTEYMGGLSPVKKYPLIEGQLKPIIVSGRVVERG